MMQETESSWKITNEQLFQVRYMDGKVTEIDGPWETGWSALPWTIIAQIEGGSVRIEFRDDPDLLVHSGEALCLLPGLTHNIVHDTSNRSRWAHLDISLMGAADALRDMTIPRVFAGEAAGRIGDLCARLAANAGDITLSRLLKRQAQACGLAAIITEGVQFTPDVATRLRLSERVRPALTFINTHLSESLSRTELARQTNLSPSQFSLLFKAATGLPPSEYVERRRMAQAHELLKDPGLTIAAVAVRVGYSDPFHFSRRFKAQFGISPRAYRETYRQNIF